MKDFISSLITIVILGVIAAVFITLLKQEGIDENGKFSPLIFPRQSQAQALQDQAEAIRE